MSAYAGGGATVWWVDEMQRVLADTAAPTDDLDAFYIYLYNEIVDLVNTPLPALPRPRRYGPRRGKRQTAQWMQ